jgi:hypothetical protein
MTIRNRELSQFGSFIFIEDESQNIGIATTATPYVGIGTTNPTEKLHVYGNAKVEGDLEITGTFNFPIGELTFDQDTNDFNFYTSGIITASEFRNTSGLALTTFDSWEVSGSNIYRVSGNVGINSSIPSQKLDVNGNIKASQFISTVSGTRFSGTPPFQVESSFVVNNLNATFLQGGVPGGTSSGDIVTIESNQTLTNKTIGGVGIIFNGSTSGSTTLRATPTAGSGSVNLPTTSGTLICSGDTGTVTSGMIVNGTIIDADISGTAAISYTKLNLTGSITNSDLAGSIANNKLLNSTISGVSLGGNLADLTAGSFITYNSGSTYNGSTARTITVNASTTGTSNIVARDGTGSFSAGSITLSSNLTANGGTVSANALSAAGGGLSVTGTAFINNSTSSTSTSSGALRVGGGVGIVENAYIGGLLRNTNTTNSTSTSTGALVVSGGLGVANNTYIGGLLNVATTITSPTLQGSTANSGTLTVRSTSSATKATAGVLFNDNIASSSTTTGTVVVTGGAGVSGNLNIGGNVNVTGSITGGISIPTLHVQDQRASGTGGGTFTSGSWQTRTLNTSVTNGISGASLISDAITLPAGTYEVEAIANAFRVDEHQIRFNGTGVTIYGLSSLAPNGVTGGTNVPMQSTSTLRGTFTIASTTSFNLEHRCSRTTTTNGFGVDCGFGNINIYADVRIRKIA